MYTVLKTPSKHDLEGPHIIRFDVHISGRLSLLTANKNNILIFGDNDNCNIFNPITY